MKFCKPDLLSKIFIIFITKIWFLKYTKKITSNSIVGSKNAGFDWGQNR